MNGQKLLAILGTAVPVLCLALSGCTPPSDTPDTQIYVLVDVSKTWHNPADDERNRRVLSELGFGAASAAEVAAANSGSPAAIQIRIIGSQSLEREPVCDVIYQKVLISMGSDKAYLLSDRRQLAQYLGKDCPELVLAIEPENRTEISNALLSVASQLPVRASNRRIVIASDFMEDAVDPTVPLDLRGFQILMLYRPLLEDQQNPQSLLDRVDKWKALFERLGAPTTAVPDTGIKRETVSSFLTAKQSEPSGKSAKSEEAK